MQHSGASYYGGMPRYMCVYDEYKGESMASKTDTEVMIGGKVYTLSGTRDEEYLQKVAMYLNGKLDEVSADENYKRLPPDTRNVLLQLNIADDYFRAKEEAAKALHEARLREKDLYDLKHELVAVQMKLEMAQKEMAVLNKENKE